VSWYEGAGAARLDHDLEIVASREELALKFVSEPGEAGALVGTITVRLRSGIGYAVETRIEFPDDYPHSEPRAFETGGRFKHEIDRHFYPDGRACLWLEKFETQWRPDDPDALGIFLDQVLVFYLRQLASKRIRRPATRGRGAATATPASSSTSRTCSGCDPRICRRCGGL
jgi:hypothetical protein